MGRQVEFCTPPSIWSVLETTAPPPPLSARYWPQCSFLWNLKVPSGVSGIWRLYILTFFISGDDLFSGFKVVAEEHGSYVVSVEWFLEKSSAEREIESVMFFWCRSESLYAFHCTVLAFHRLPLSVINRTAMFVLLRCALYSDGTCLINSGQNYSSSALLSGLISDRSWSGRWMNSSILIFKHVEAVREMTF